MLKNELLQDLVTEPPPPGIVRLRRDLGADRAALDRFCDSPGKVLRSYGIDADETIALGDREKALIRLFFDPRVGELYHARRLDALREYIVAQHPGVGIANPTDLAGAVAYVDVDVAVVAEAVAVAVAVTAIAVVGSPYARPGFAETVEPLGKRVAALEERLADLELLEARLALLEARIS